MFICYHLINLVPCRVENHDIIDTGEISLLLALLTLNKPDILTILKALGTIKMPTGKHSWRLISLIKLPNA